MATPIPFGHGPWNDKKQDEYIADSATFNQGVTDATNQSSDETRGLEKEQRSRSKESLDPNAGKNIAQGQGQYGMINNRNYAKTLRLAREADAYNNKPQAHIVRVGSVFGSGIQDMGTGYDRPKIQTMETRAMDQSFQLDTSQKQLAQALQDAVNHKDLNAFIKTYSQLYGITLDKQQAMADMKVHPYFMKDYETAASNYTLGKLASCIGYLYDTDLRSKGIRNSGNISDGELLKELVFKIIH